MTFSRGTLHDTSKECSTLASLSISRMKPLSLCYDIAFKCILGSSIAELMRDAGSSFGLLLFIL